MGRKFSYEVLVRATPKLAWEVFSNWRRWHTFSNVYGRIEWVKGDPWQVGSRMNIEILQPIRTVIDHVITHCEPGEKVGWIDHAMGIAIDQWVTFESKNGSGTRVKTVGEIVGADVTLSNGLTLERFVNDFTRHWYDAFAEVCNQLAPSPWPSAHQQR